ncbi:DUF6074 family protein [Chelativorans sp. YIM 93263]|uniref:DUF6074 family protein n=1 Tax=Chelativorans sp. YIM 93263 TaxID=2906648 RepID=UPI0023793AD9|nr:DUF6074 family protein [Chelativorans sp. YIM 93263]
MNVVAFPLYRRRDWVQELARGLSVRGHEEANLFWRAFAKQMLEQLTACGVPMEEAREEVRNFFYVALDEMQSAIAERC